MSLENTPIYRNLRTRVTFAGLEYEDLAVVLFTAGLAMAPRSSAPEACWAVIARCATA